MQQSAEHLASVGEKRNSVTGLIEKSEWKRLLTEPLHREKEGLK
jgi:hypothetical protein